MGFYIRPLKGKKSLPNWKVQFISYKEGKVMFLSEISF